METVNVAPYISMLYRKLIEGLISGTQWVYTPGWTEELALLGLALGIAWARRRRERQRSAR